MAFHYDACAAHLQDVQDVLLNPFYGNAVGIQCMGHLFNRAGNTNVYLVPGIRRTARSKEC